MNDGDFSDHDYKITHSIPLFMLIVVDGKIP
jgi:hypothetical protein